LVEQTERVRLALAPVLHLTGKTIRRANLDETPLALKACLLRNQGWTNALIRRFLGAPDTTSLEPLFAAERVEQVEASEPFQERWVRLKERRARAVVEARASVEEKRIQEDNRRAMEYAESLKRENARENAMRTAFPGFQFAAYFCQDSNSVNVCIGVEGGPSTSAPVSRAEGYALARGCEEASFWPPLIDWISGVR
jgi:hypothetical protein